MTTSIVSQITISISDRDATDDLHHTSAPIVSYLHNEDYTLSVAPAQGNTPIPIFDVEGKAFPVHFPHNSNTLIDDRPKKIGMHRYFNSRLFSSDNRFASDPEYIFYALDYVERKTLQQQTSIAFRKASPTNLTTNITVSTLQDSSQVSALLKKDIGYRFMTGVRGSPPYWDKTLKDLFALLRQLGTPTWFCSFSAADRRWVEIPIAILKQQNKPIPEDLSWSEHCNIINSNPVTACRMFEERVRLFLQEVLFKHPHPIGEIEDYFMRTEFQSRGWPHIHALFWVKNAPKFTPNGDNSDYIRMIDDHVTTRLPNPETETKLHSLVTTLQVSTSYH